MVKTALPRQGMLVRSLVGEVKWQMLRGTAKLLQSCPTLCDFIDGSPPGSTVPGILQARTLEWVAISFSSCEAQHPPPKKKN